MKIHQQINFLLREFCENDGDNPQSDIIILAKMMLTALQDRTRGLILGVV